MRSAGGGNSPSADQILDGQGNPREGAGVSLLPSKIGLSRLFQGHLRCQRDIGMDSGFHLFDPTEDRLGDFPGSDFFLPEHLMQLMGGHLAEFHHGSSGKDSCSFAEGDALSGAIIR